MKYKRVGKCNDCGECCQGCDSFNLAAKGHCAIYKNRPQICVDFPWCPRANYGYANCDFTFEDEKGNKVTARLQGLAKSATTITSKPCQSCTLQQDCSQDEKA